MNTLKINFLTVIVIAGAQIVPAQPQLTDDMARSLGIDPVAARAAAEKRKREGPTPEEVALRERAEEAVKTLTDQKMAAFDSNDPLLQAIYAQCVGLMDYSLVEWVPIVNRDIYRRKEGHEIMDRIFWAKTKPDMKSSVMFWLGNHLDVKWGDEIMDEAIKLYRADPKKWDSSSVYILGRTVARRGNESHLAFFDELDKTEFGNGDNRGHLEYRIKKAKEAAAAASSQAVPPTQIPKSAQLESSGQTREQSQEAGAVSRGWVAGGVIVIATLGFLWLVLKGKK